jgi:hypothetical protein
MLSRARKLEILALFEKMTIFSHRKCENAKKHVQFPRLKSVKLFQTTRKPQFFLAPRGRSRSQGTHFFLPEMPYLSLAVAQKSLSEPSPKM